MFDSTHVMLLQTEPQYVCAFIPNSNANAVIPAVKNASQEKISTSVVLGI